MQKIYSLTALLSLAFFSSHQVKAQNCLPDSAYAGQASYYTVNSVGNCSFPVPASPIYIAAMNPVQYDTAATCGTCLLITSWKDSLIVSVEDQCPGCSVNNIDLSADAATVLDSAPGFTTIKWKYVGCPVVGNVSFVFQGSNPFYGKVQVRNHRYAIKKFEYDSAGTYVTLPKTSDNFFLASAGMGNGPYKFRVTDIVGNSIIEDSIPLTPNDSVTVGKNQFPVCTQTAINEVMESYLGIQLRTDAAHHHQFIIANNTNDAVDYVVYDVVGRMISKGKSNGYSQQTIATPSTGLYLVNYPLLQNGKVAQKVVVP